MGGITPQLLQKSAEAAIASREELARGGQLNGTLNNTRHRAGLLF